MYAGDPRLTIGGPSSGVSLSQPGHMISHRHGHGMMDIHGGGHPHYMGGASGMEKASQGRGSSSKLTEQGRGNQTTGLSIDEELDLDVEDEEDRQSKVHGVM